MSFDEHRWHSEDGLSLYFRDYPAVGGDDGRLPVVCLHGLTRNSKDFANLAAHLAAKGRRVIVPDMRGRGRSEYDPQPQRYHVRTYARDVVAMMDALTIPKAVLVGTSMGGLITMALAAGHRDRIAAAILNDVGPSVGAEGLERIKGYAGKRASINNWDEAELYLQRINRDAFPDFTRGDWLDFARLTFRADEQGRPAIDYDPAVAGPLKHPRLASAIAWFLFWRLTRHCPTMVLRGELSDILTAPIAAKMKRFAPSITLVDVPRVGHAPLLDEQVVSAAMADFLGKVP